MKNLLILIFSFLIQNTALAYTQFISQGYTSCSTCHYNPYGNGPLNDYGRVIGASMLSSRDFYNKDKSEESIAENTGFLYSNIKKSNPYIKPSVNYRGLWYKSSLNTKDEQEKYLTMFLSANVAVQSKDKKTFAVIEAGYIPNNNQADANRESEVRSREHYIGHQLNESTGVYLGLMDKVFGLRVPDHNLYSRSTTQNTMNDQSHSVLLNYKDNKFEVGLQGLFGNLSQDADLRQKGFSSKFEYFFKKNLGASFSYLSTNNSFNFFSAKAVDLRVGVSKKSTLMLELGETQKEVIAGKIKTSSRYLTMQNYLNLRRGLYSLLTLEYLDSNINEKGHILRAGPGVQWFPINGVEVRVDLYNKKSFSSIASNEDVWDLAGQLHLWF